MSFVQEATASLRPSGEPTSPNGRRSRSRCSMHSRPLMTASLSRSRTRRLKPSLPTSSSPPGGAKRASGFAGCCGASSSEGKGPRLSPPGLAPAPRAVRMIGFAGLIVGRDDISLRAPLFSVDVWAIEESAAETGDVHPLLLDRKRLPETLCAGSRSSTRRSGCGSSCSVKPCTRGSRAVSSARSTRRTGSLTTGRPRDRAPEPRSDPRGRLPHPDGGPCGTWRHGRRAQGLQGVVGPPGRGIDSEPSDQTKDLVVRIKTGEFKGRAPAESAESVSPEPSPFHPLRLWERPSPRATSCRRSLPSRRIIS